MSHTFGRMRRGLDDITTIVVHHSNTPNGDGRVNIVRIDDWHRARGFQRDTYAVENQHVGLKHIGYHVVIHADGSVFRGRFDDEVGAQAKGYNRQSLGVCMVGCDKFAPEQWLALSAQVFDWIELYGGLKVIGHREVNHNKLCPGFDVQRWLSIGMVPLIEHTLERSSS